MLSVQFNFLSLTHSRRCSTPDGGTSLSYSDLHFPIIRPSSTAHLISSPSMSPYSLRLAFLAIPRFVHQA